MTTEEAIWTLQYVDHEDPTFSKAVSMAIAALRTQMEAEKNDPLTLDELLKMDGEPVWCVSMINGKSEWGILRIVEMQKTWFIAMAGTSSGYGDKDSYGNTWLAYRRKPEGGGRNDRMDQREGQASGRIHR